MNHTARHIRIKRQLKMLSEEIDSLMCDNKEPDHQYIEEDCDNMVLQELFAYTVAGFLIMIVYKYFSRKQLTRINQGSTSNQHRISNMIGNANIAPKKMGNIHPFMDIT